MVFRTVQYTQPGAGWVRFEQRPKRLPGTPYFVRLGVHFHTTAEHDMKREYLPNYTSRGFTLIELLVVITIIAILGALIVPKVMGRPDEARIIAAKQDIGSLVQALKMYKLDNLRYPSTEQGLQALVKKPTVAPIPGNWKSYLDRLPQDPWKHPYQYLQPGLHGEIDVMSFGADGVAGGEGNDADIGSWEL